MRTLARSSLLLAALAAACGGKAPAGDTTPGPTSGPTPSPSPTPAPPPVVDEGPTAEQSLDWVIATIEAGAAPGGKGLTAADAQARFAPSFLKQVPAEQVVTIFAELSKQLPPIKKLKVDGEPRTKLSALLDTAAGGVRVVVEMTPTTPRTIAGLLFQPATSEAPPRTYGDAVAQLEQAGSKTQLFVAEIEKGACTPRQNHHSTDRLAIGSAAKLWVLLALDDKLKADKKLSWDSPLAIRDEAKSLPSGELQDLAAGTTVPLREAALKMISISDNTATDHLIDFVGREQVEKALKTAKHGEPARNVPFLRTRELFALKLALTPEEQDRYRKMPAAAKKKVLDGYRARALPALDTVVKDWTAPRALDLEWFASGPDLCNVMATLGARGGWDPASEELTILGKNAGVPFDKGKWSYVGFKGGSEPGVINLTWLGKRVDGKWFVLVVTVNDDGKPLDEALVINAAAGSLAILGNEAP